MGIDGSGMDGIAYSFLMVVFFLIISAFFYLLAGQLYNAILVPTNKMITDGEMSLQTANAMDWQKGFFMGTPLITLIAVFVWAVAAKAVSPGTVQFSSFYTGWTIYISLVIVSFVMTFAGGILIDHLYTGLDNAGMIGDGTADSKITGAWATAQQDTMWYFINVYFFLCYFVPILGCAALFQSVARDTAGTRYFRTGY